MSEIIERRGYVRRLYFTRGNQIQDTRAILCGPSYDGDGAWGSSYNPGLPLDVFLEETSRALVQLEDVCITVVAGNYESALAVLGWRRITDGELAVFSMVEQEEREAEERLKALNEATLREELRELAAQYPDEIERFLEEENQ